MKTRLTPVLFTLGLVSSLQATDWPQFRGPDRTDVSTETGLLKQWPAEGPKKTWTYDQGGMGYSGFSVANGTLYTMGARDAQEFVIALDAATGKEKWVAEVGVLLTNNWGDGPRGTPSVDGDRVYALGGKGSLVCLNAKDGKQVWKAEMTEFGGKVPGWGYTESVLVDGKNVISTPGGSKGTLLALDKMTGKLVWQSTEWTDGAHYASVITAELNGAHQLIARTANSIAGVDSNDGKLLWKQAFPQGKTAVIPTPIYKDGQVYVAAGYNAGCMAIKIDAKNVPTVAYENANMVNHHGGVILVGDYLYGYSDKGGWTCQDFKTGDVKWAEKKLGKGAIHCADGMLYLLEEATGTVALIDASPNGWSEHGRFKLEPQTALRKPQGKIWTHPVVSNGKLYLRDQELISCFDVKG